MFLRYAQPLHFPENLQKRGHRPNSEREVLTVEPQPFGWEGHPGTCHTIPPEGPCTPASAEAAPGSRGSVCLCLSCPTCPIYFHMSVDFGYKLPICTLNNTHICVCIRERGEGGSEESKAPTVCSNPPNSPCGVSLVISIFRKKTLRLRSSSPAPAFIFFPLRPSLLSDIDVIFTG